MRNGGILGPILIAVSHNMSKIDSQSLYSEGKFMIREDKTSIVSQA